MAEVVAGCFDPIGELGHYRRMKPMMMMMMMGRHIIARHAVGRVEAECDVNKALQFLPKAAPQGFTSLQFAIHFLTGYRQVCAVGRLLSSVTDETSGSLVMSLLAYSASLPVPVPFLSHCEHSDSLRLLSLHRRRCDGESGPGWRFSTQTQTNQPTQLSNYG